MVNIFEDLIVWRKAHQLTLLIYKLTKLFPSDERFGLINQLRRAAVSVENNIAEGFGRRSDKSFILFLNTSLGSLFEVMSMVRLSYDLAYIDHNQKNALGALLSEIDKMLKGLIFSLK